MRSKGLLCGFAAISLGVTGCTKTTTEPDPVDDTPIAFTDQELIDALHRDPMITQLTDALEMRNCPVGEFEITRDQPQFGLVSVRATGSCRDELDPPTETWAASTFLNMVALPGGAIFVFAQYIGYHGMGEVGADPAAELLEFTYFFDGDSVREMDTREWLTALMEPVGGAASPLVGAGADVAGAQAALCDKWNEVTLALTYGGSGVYSPCPSELGSADVGCGGCRSAVKTAYDRIHSAGMGQAIAEATGFGGASDITGALAILSGEKDCGNWLDDLGCNIVHTFGAGQSGIVSGGDAAGAEGLASWANAENQGNAIIDAHDNHNYPSDTWQWWYCHEKVNHICAENCYNDGEGETTHRCGHWQEWGVHDDNPCEAIDIDGDGIGNGLVPCCKQESDAYCLGMR